jgi:hypothetical protein
MIDKSPLNRRGWVYQERFLSPRILHFTSSQLFWQCKTHLVCETYPLIYPFTDFSRYLHQINSFNPEVDGLKIRQRDGGEIFHRSKDPFLDTFAVWKEVVANYSKCHLTQETDKLVAFSGIAAMVNKTLDYDYLAGMWREHLPYNLTWRGLEENGRPASYVAPSWSWAAVTGGVQTKSLKDWPNECSVEIIEASVELAGLSKFGQVKSGFIRLQGNLVAAPLSMCHIEELNQPCISCKENSEFLCLKFAFDVSRAGVNRFDEDFQRLHFPIILAKTICPEKISENHLVYGLPILSIWLGGTQVTDGLLLEATGKIGEFRRIGMFSYEAREGAQGNAPIHLLKAFRAFDSHAVSLGFDPIPTNHPDYDFQYIITII